MPGLDVMFRSFFAHYTYASKTDVRLKTFLLFPAWHFGEGSLPPVTHLCLGCSAAPAEPAPYLQGTSRHMCTPQIPHREAPDEPPPKPLLISQCHDLTCSVKRFQDRAGAGSAPHAECTRPEAHGCWLHSSCRGEDVEVGRASMEGPVLSAHMGGRGCLSCGIPSPLRPGPLPGLSQTRAQPRAAQLHCIHSPWAVRGCALHSPDVLLQQPRHLPFSPRADVPLQSQQIKCQEERTRMQNPSTAPLNPAPLLRLPPTRLWQVRMPPNTSVQEPSPALAPEDTHWTRLAQGADIQEP